MQKIHLWLVLFVTLACFVFTLSALRIGQSTSNSVLAYSESCEFPSGILSKIYIADWRYGIRYPVPEQSVSFVPPSWSPNGQKLAYTVDLNGAYQIYTRDLMTGLVQEISVNLHSSSSTPSWSPNGYLIAFVSSNKLAVANLRTGNVRIYPIEIASNVYLDGWSADGDLLAFSGSYPNTREGIFILNTVTEKIEKLSTEQFNLVSRPTWSPDGHYLTFTGSDFTRSAIYLVDLNTGLMNELTKNDVPFYIASSWSPDGEKIATLTENSKVHVFNKDGMLTQKLSFQQIEGLGGGEGQVSWSPDGKDIALYLPVNSLWRNYIFSLSSDEIYGISPNSCYYSPVDWRP